MSANPGPGPLQHSSSTLLSSVGSTRSVASTLKRVARSRSRPRPRRAASFRGAAHGPGDLGILCPPRVRIDYYVAVRASTTDSTGGPTRKSGKPSALSPTSASQSGIEAGRSHKKVTGPTPVLVGDTPVRRRADHPLCDDAPGPGLCPEYIISTWSTTARPLGQPRQRTRGRRRPSSDHRPDPAAQRLESFLQRGTGN